MEINFTITPSFNLAGFLEDCYKNGVKLFLKNPGDVTDGSVTSAGVTLTVKLPINDPVKVALVEEKVALYADGIPGPVVVPASVSPRQIRLSMLAHGLNLADVDAFIETLPEPDKSAAKVSWEYSVEISRTDPMVTAVGVALNLTNEQIDDIFVGAQGL